VNVLLVGASYREIPLTTLEVLESKADAIRSAICGEESLAHGIEGCVVVSTCNRFEVYVESDDHELSAQYIRNSITAVAGIDATGIAIVPASDAVTHLFRVSAGLESMIVGEVEIAGQIKRSLSQAQLLGQTSRITEALFQRAAEVSKKVATETGLGTAGRSLITGGLDILKKRNFDLAHKKVLVIGTGAYARVVTSALEREGVGEIFTYSSSGRAEIFAESHNTTPISTDGLEAALQKIDLIVACSGTHGAVITTEQIAAVKKEVLPIIDLSLARDVEKSVESLPHIMVIDLEEIYRCAPAEHHETIATAQGIIEESVEEFAADLKARRNDPLIRQLREHVESIVQEEVDRVRRKSGEEVASQVERSLQLVTKNIFHKPTIAARESAVKDQTDAYQEAIQTLFGLTLESTDE